MTYSPYRDRQEKNSPWTDDEIQESMLREYLRQLIQDVAEEQGEDEDDDLHP